VLAGEPLVADQQLEEYLEEFSSHFSLDSNMNLFQEIAHGFNFVKCIELLEVYPQLVGQPSGSNE